MIILKVQRKSMYFKSWFGLVFDKPIYLILGVLIGALEDTEGSWLGFGILNMVTSLLTFFSNHE